MKWPEDDSRWGMMFVLVCFLEVQRSVLSVWIIGVHLCISYVVDVVGQVSACAKYQGVILVWLQEVVLPRCSWVGAAFAENLGVTLIPWQIAEEEASMIVACTERQLNMENSWYTTERVLKLSGRSMVPTTRDCNNMMGVDCHGFRSSDSS